MLRSQLWAQTSVMEQTRSEHDVDPTTENRDTSGRECEAPVLLAYNQIFYKTLLDEDRIILRMQTHLLYLPFDLIPEIDVVVDLPSFTHCSICA